MTKAEKVTRRSVLASFLALAVCISMLVGTSYAWFTDSVTSSGNIIKSGKLSIDLGIKTKDDNDYVSVKNNPDKKAFNYEKWEPGYTEWVNAKVFTDGNLALKYTMRIVANGEVSDLANVIDVYYKPEEIAKPAARDLSGLKKLGTLADAINGTIVINDTLIPEEGNTEDFATLALHMQEKAGNEYQDMSIGADFSFQILATQYTYEKDSFDELYDDGLIPADGMVYQKSGIFTLGITDDGDIILVNSTEDLSDQDLVVPEGVTVVGENAFANVPLNSITTSSTVKEISNYAFMSDSSTYATGAITAVTLNSGLEKIGYRAFKAQPITSLTIPNTVKEIKGAFYQCSSLTSVTFEPTSQITDFTQAFSYCTSLTSIDLPDNLVIFGQDALRETAITTLTIPATVTTIGSQALRQCMNLTDIYLNCNTTPTIANNTFTNCNHTITIHVANANVLNDLLTANNMQENVAKTVWGTSIILTSVT